MYVGGLIGRHRVANGGIVNNCYSVGSVSGSSVVYGLIGDNNGVPVNNVTNCFWDTETSLCGTSPGGGTGKTTAEMKTLSTFTNAGWDFSAIWEISPGFYPRLKQSFDSALPVELISFTASAENTGIALIWQTASEMNNYGFGIERRIDTKEQSAVVAWTTIGFAEGHGSTNAPQSYRYVDASIIGNVSYRLKQIDRDGKFVYSNEVKVTVDALSEGLVLSQNFPNPFNPTTNISFTVPSNGWATLKIVNILGQEVATLFNGEAQRGILNRVVFNASGFASGIYFSHLEHNGNVQLKTMHLIK